MLQSNLLVLHGKLWTYIVEVLLHIEITNGGPPSFDAVPRKFSE